MRRYALSIIVSIIGCSFVMLLVALEQYELLDALFTFSIIIYLMISRFMITTMYRQVIKKMKKKKK
jgi:hypothetical protein